MHGQRRENEHISGEHRRQFPEGRVAQHLAQSVAVFGDRLRRQDTGHILTEHDVQWQADEQLRHPKPDPPVIRMPNRHLKWRVLMRGVLRQAAYAPIRTFKEAAGCVAPRAIQRQKLEDEHVLRI